MTSDEDGMRMKISPPWIEEPEQQLVTKSILHLKPIQCVALGLPIMCLPSNQSTKSLCYEVVGDVMWYVVIVVVEQFKINLMATGPCCCVVVMTSSHCTSHTLPAPAQPVYCQTSFWLILSLGKLISKHQLNVYHRRNE